MVEFNTDSFRIKNYEITPEGYANLWIVGGVPNKTLVYDGGKRKEIIQEDSLFDEASIKTAMGKHLTYPEHPPRPINSKNYSNFSKGVVLQEYSKDEATGALVLSAIVHDAEMVEGIVSGKIKYISAGYTADKEPNNDGVLIQKNRVYNHFTGLGEQYTPRAGEESKILIFEEKAQNDAENVTNGEKPSTDSQIDKNIQTLTTGSNEAGNNTDGNKETQEKMNLDIEERVELLSTWKPVLEEHKKAIDYSLDSTSIKRLILSCYYPEKTIKALNDDAVLKGFWLNFVSDESKLQVDGQAALPDTTYQRSTPSSRVMNFDSQVDSVRDKYIKLMETGKV